MDKPTHEFTDVRSHHLVPVREGSLGNEPTYVQTCACGVTYRNGMMWPPIGAAGEPYYREHALEAALAAEELERSVQKLTETVKRATGPRIGIVRSSELGDDWRPSTHLP
jgi:hypothetical protein